MYAAFCFYSFLLYEEDFFTQLTLSGSFVLSLQPDPTYFARVKAELAEKGVR